MVCIRRYYLHLVEWIRVESVHSEENVSTPRGAVVVDKEDEESVELSESSVKDGEIRPMSDFRNSENPNNYFSDHESDHDWDTDWDSDSDLDNNDSEEEFINKEAFNKSIIANYNTQDVEIDQEIVQKISTIKDKNIFSFFFIFF